MRNFYVGCGPIPTSRKGYFKEFNALEISETWYQPFGLDALKDWRKEAGKDAHLIMHIWRWIALDHLELKSEPPLDVPIGDVGMLRPTDANRKLWQEVKKQTEALKADAVWIRTPASLSPSHTNRAQIEAFNSDVVGEVPFKIYWEARGMWDPEDAMEFANSLGWLLVTDPHQEFELPEAQGENGVYVHHQPRGRKNFDRDDCEELLDIYEEHEGDVVAIFRGASRLRNAQRMREVYKERQG